MYSLSLSCPWKPLRVRHSNTLYRAIRRHQSDYLLPSREMSKSTPDGAHLKKPLPEARPSSSVLLISPKNQILLLHRVKTSSSFASAHVFPGGNLSAEHDGEIPDVKSPMRHRDSETYRFGAIRECFEESGILLARREDGRGLWDMSDSEREAGRKTIHANQVNFKAWLSEHGGKADIENLVPFTRWLTPPHLPKRYTTQMYLYFLPLEDVEELGADALTLTKQALIPNPTSDGGLEHTEAQFLPPHEWLSLAQSGSIILFPPQFFLLFLLSPYLSPSGFSGVPSRAELQAQRNSVLDFLKTGTPPWGEKCIGEQGSLWKQSDGREVLSLEKPGVELEGTDRKGDDEFVLLLKMSKDGPRGLEVRKRKDVLEEARRMKHSGLNL